MDSTNGAGKISANYRKFLIKEKQRLSNENTEIIQSLGDEKTRETNENYQNGKEILEHNQSRIEQIDALLRLETYKVIHQNKMIDIGNGAKLMLDGGEKLSIILDGPRICAKRGGDFQIITTNSPLGKALYGKKTGEKFSNGSVSGKIEKIYFPKDVREHFKSEANVSMPVAKKRVPTGKLLV